MHPFKNLLYLFFLFSFVLALNNSFAFSSCTLDMSRDIFKASRAVFLCLFLCIMLMYPLTSPIHTGLIDKRI